MFTNEKLSGESGLLGMINSLTRQLDDAFEHLNMMKNLFKQIEENSEFKSLSDEYLKVYTDAKTVILTILGE